ncbi:MAG: N-acetylmuramic acid 6-phosphate etherase [Peptoniphilaceae bacterium]|nr:N-acetylmuramic acid 6-phosphate etherase [Peptoniphilaceae bacterium]MDY6018965.1 N-acetylmuramic acid 6-phosphate etherase [Anaerococcus sp.]
MKNTTEKRNDRSSKLSSMETADILKLINEEDQTVAQAVKRELKNIEKAVDLIVDSFRKGGRLIYIGAGTSGRLGVLDASECLPTFSAPKDMVIGLIAGGDEALRNPIENAEDSLEFVKNDLEKISLNKKDTLVGIAASGRTPYVIGGLEYANKISANTISLACNEDAEISKYADVAIEVVTGPEVITGSTRMKAGTGQKMVLNMLSTTAMIKLGKTYKNYMVDLKPTNEKLIDRATRIIEEICKIDYEKAQKYLYDAKMKVKVAILMQKLGLGYEKANELLKENKGILDNIIGE